MSIKNILKSTARKLLPKSVFNHLKAQLYSDKYYPPMGWVRFGDLRRLEPITKNWGLKRGFPVDRYYIEKFLASNSDDIHGRVLEIKDNYYTRKFGKERVTHSDILNYEEGINPDTTIIADLSSAPQIPSDAFDCIIFTQTLQYIYNLHSAIETLFRILKPGGVILATVPGISQVSPAPWDKYWCWNFSSVSAEKLFLEKFPENNVEIQGYGNVLIATCYFYGLVAEELNQKELDYHDHSYEIIITIKAAKPN